MAFVMLLIRRCVVNPRELTVILNKKRPIYSAFFYFVIYRGAHAVGIKWIFQ